MHTRSLAAPLGVAAVAASGCVFVWLANPTVPGGILPVCPTKALLGIDCPGCGSLRMIYSLLHLDVTAALRYNAVGMVAALLLVWAFAAWTYGRIVGRRVLSWQHLRWSAPAALAVTLAWFVVRNLGFGPFSVLYV
jgi:Protein of unknown function (DUF2752)